MTDTTAQGIHVMAEGYHKPDSVREAFRRIVERGHAPDCPAKNDCAVPCSCGVNEASLWLMDNPPPPE